MVCKAQNAKSTDDEVPAIEHDRAHAAASAPASTVHCLMFITCVKYSTTPQNKTWCTHTCDFQNLRIFINCVKKAVPKTWRGVKNLASESPASMMQSVQSQAVPREVDLLCVNIAVSSGNEVLSSCRSRVPSTTRRPTPPLYLLLRLFLLFIAR